MSFRKTKSPTENVIKSPTENVVTSTIIQSQQKGIINIHNLQENNSKINQSIVPIILKKDIRITKLYLKLFLINTYHHHMININHHYIIMMT